MAKTTAKWIEFDWNTTDAVLASSILYSETQNVSTAIASVTQSTTNLQASFLALSSSLSAEIGTICGAFLPLAGGAMSGDIIPNTTSTYNLGSPSKLWFDVYVYNGSLVSQLAAITAKEAVDVTAVSSQITGSYSAAAGASALALNAAASASNALDYAIGADAAVISMCGTVQSLSSTIISIVPVTAQVSDLQSQFTILSTQLTTGEVAIISNVSTISGNLTTVTNRTTSAEQNIIINAQALTGFIPLSGSSSLFGDLIPSSGNSLTLGSSGKLLKDIYLNEFGSLVTSLSSLSSSIILGRAEYLVGTNKAYITIQSAIDAASADGFGTDKEFSVNIDSGTYNENVELIPGAYLQGTGAGDKTVISGLVSLSFNPPTSASLNKATLTRLTVQGNTSAALVDLAGSYPLIIDLIEINVVNSGPGIKISNNDIASIINIKESRITSNDAACISIGAGSFILNDSTLIAPYSLSANAGSFASYDSYLSGVLFGANASVNYHIINSYIDTVSTCISGGNLYNGLITYVGANSGSVATTIIPYLLDGTFYYSGASSSLSSRNVSNALSELSRIDSNNLQIITTLSSNLSANPSQILSLSSQMLSANTNIDALSTLVVNIPSLSAQILSAEVNITSLSAQVLSSVINITSLSAQVLSAEVNITSLSSIVLSSVVNVTSLSSQMLSAEVNITALSSQSLSSVANISSLSSHMLSAEVNITSLSSQILSSNNNITTLSSELLSSNFWNSAYATTITSSADWSSSYTTVCAWSAYWGAGISGDYIMGPVSSTNNAIVRWDGISGRIVKDYELNAPTVDSSGNITVNGYLNFPTTSINGGYLAFGGDPIIHNYGVLENVYVGGLAGNFTNIGGANSSLGSKSLQSISGGYFNTAIGKESCWGLVAGGQNTAIGAFSLYLSNGSNNVAIGYYAGAYDTVSSNSFYLNNQDRGSLVNDQTKSLLYGTFSSITSAQQLTVNGNMTVSGLFTMGLSGTPATSGETGTPGMMKWDADYLYICVSGDTWRRASLSGW